MGFAALKAMPTPGNAVAAPVSAVPALPAVTPEPLTLTASERATALERLRFLDAVADVRRTNRAIRNDADAVLLVATRDAELYPILTRAGKHGKSALTFPNWRVWRRKLGSYQTCTEAAIFAVADHYKRGTATAKDFYGDPRFWELFFSFYLNINKNDAPQCYRLAVRKCRAENPLAIIPTEHQAYYRIGQIPEDQLIQAREGDEAFKNRVCYYNRRTWQDVQPGQMIVCDSRTFDTRVQIPGPDGNPVSVRPVIAGLMDARSWYLASYYITVDAVNTSILVDTLDLYLRNTGGVPPLQAYTDNGLDYCARGFSTPLIVDGHEHSIFNELGIKQIRSIAYNGRAKTIERCFQTMMKRFDKLFPDYLGSKPGQRTPNAAYFDRHPEELPTLDTFIRIFEGYRQEYHQTVNKGEILGGRSPEELWNSRPDRVAMSPERIAAARLLPRDVRKVGRGYSVTWGREMYFNDDLPFNREVLIKTDHRDMSRVLCCNPDGSMIGWASTRARIAAYASGDPDEIRKIQEGARIAYRQTKRVKTALLDRSGGLHLVSPLEIMLTDDPKARPVRCHGTYKSVKGASHTVARYVLSGSATLAASAPAELPAAAPLAPEFEPVPEPRKPVFDVSADKLKQAASFMKNFAAIAAEE